MFSFSNDNRRLGPGTTPPRRFATSPHATTTLQRRYQAQTTRIASFGPLVSVFFYNYSLSFILTAIYYRVSNVPKRRDQQQGSRHVSSPYRCHVTHHHYPTSRAMPLPCHTKPPPPENTHRARTTVVLPSFGPNKYFFIFVFIDIFIDIHVDIFIGIVNVIN